MDALREETGTWPAAYWFLQRDSGIPDHLNHRDGKSLILFSSMERADRFHDGFPAERTECWPEAVEVSRVPALVTQRFPPGAVRHYVLDPEPGDFGADGLLVHGLSRWPLTIIGLCGYLPLPT